MSVPFFQYAGPQKVELLFQAQGPQMPNNPGPKIVKSNPFPARRATDYIFWKTIRESIDSEKAGFGEKIDRAALLPSGQARSDADSGQKMNDFRFSGTLCGIARVTSPHLDLGWLGRSTVSGTCVQRVTSDTRIRKLEPNIEVRDCRVKIED
jgi:hypothetical protein